MHLNHQKLPRLLSKVVPVMPPIDINPIIPGFSPDPSIIRIDKDFFLVNSTFHMFPGLPIYTSQDLISWKHIGLFFFPKAFQIY